MPRTPADFKTRTHTLSILWMLVHVSSFLIHSAHNTAQTWAKLNYHSREWNEIELEIRLLQTVDSTANKSSIKMISTMKKEAMLPTCFTVNSFYLFILFIKYFCISSSVTTLYPHSMSHPPLWLGQVLVYQHWRWLTWRDRLELWVRMKATNTFRVAMNIPMSWSTMMIECPVSLHHWRHSQRNSVNRGEYAVC